MAEACTVQMGWAHPSNLALLMLAGFAFVLGLAVAPHRSPAIEAGQGRG